MAQFSELHDALSKPWLSFFTAVVFLLTQNCAGLPQVVGPSQPVLATVGDDIVLSCRLEPAVDASDMSIEWSRKDLDPSYVYVWWDREELESSKHADYQGRTSLLFSKLEFGDVSLKLSKVKSSDQGKYRCFIPTLGQGSTVELIVGDFFLSKSSYMSTTVGLAVSLAAAIILFILAVVLFVRARRQKRKRKTLEGTNQLLEGNNSETNNQLQQEKLKNEKSESEMKILKKRAEELERRNSDTDNQLQQEKQKNKHLKSQLNELEKTERNLQDEKLKSMKIGKKLKTVIHKMNKELDEMNFDTNSDPTGSDENNQQEELEKLQDEKQKWMTTFENLKTELQSMNEELTGPIILHDFHKRGLYIRLKNISTEEIKLEGWKIELQRNNRNPATCTFDKSLKLQVGEILCIRNPAFMSIKYPHDVDLEWSDMKWSHEDKLKIISNDRDIFRLL